MKILIGFILAGVFSSFSFATTTQQLLRSTSDAFTGNLDLQVDLSDTGDVEAIRSISPNGAKVFEVSELSTGIVLYNSKGHDVIILKAPVLDVTHGGKVEVSYLTDALTGSYDSLEVEAEHQPSLWEIMVDDETGYHAVTHAFFKSRKVFGQIVGIDSIQWQ